MNDADRAAAKDADADGELRFHGLPRCVSSTSPQETYAAAYNVVANETLWFWHHHMFDSAHRPRLDATFRAAWESFRELNLAAGDGGRRRRGTRRHRARARLPARARRRRCCAPQRPDVRIAHFTHTPWVDPALLGLLPDDIVEELLLGMAGADAVRLPRAAVGRRVRRLLAGARQRRGRCRSRARSSHRRPPITTRSHTSPPAPSARAEAASVRSGGRRPRVHRARRPDRAVEEPAARVVGVPRVAVVAPGVAQPGRACWRCVTRAASRLAEYQTLLHDVVEAAGALNREFGTDDVVAGVPRHQRRLRSLGRRPAAAPTCCWSTRSATASTSSRTRVRRSTSATPRWCCHGEAGAWDELGPAGAIVVNPFDVVGTAEALHHRAQPRTTTERARPRYAHAARRSHGAAARRVAAETDRRRARYARLRRRRDRHGERPASPARPPSIGRRRQRHLVAPDAVGVRLEHDAVAHPLHDVHGRAHRPDEPARAAGVEVGRAVDGQRDVGVDDGELGRRCETPRLASRPHPTRRPGGATADAQQLADAPAVAGPQRLARERAGSRRQQFADAEVAERRRSARLRRSRPWPAARRGRAARRSRAAFARRR